MQQIFSFLSDIAKNNNREWFVEHRDEYEKAHAEFEQMVEQLISRIAQFDPSVGHVSVKSALYRFYRDTRFSLDKSPYKQHFGAYINAMGKKSMHGGYYLHIQPNNCMLAGGDYCLSGPILKAVRKTIVERTTEYQAIINDTKFKRLFPIIGMERLKTWPTGFDRSFPYPELIRPKDYSVCHKVNDDFFDNSSWLDKATDVFRTMKPFLDFVNDTIDDYI